MTPGSAKPLLVLGLGNTLLSDDGVGPVLLARLAELWGEDSRVDFVDGGTQGLALLGALSGRECVLILDAFRHGAEPGARRVWRDPNLAALGATKSASAHEGNGGELLSVAALTGDLPPRVIVLGIEPNVMLTGLSLSPSVQRALPEALTCAWQLLEEAVGELTCA